MIGDRANSDRAEPVALNTITLDPFNPSYENSVISITDTMDDSTG